MATGSLNLPKGFVLEDKPMGLPEGFVLENQAPVNLPEGFQLETPQQTPIPTQLQEQAWGEYLKSEFSPQGLMAGAKRAASLLTIPRDVGQQLADPIAENILAYSRGEKGYGQAWKDMGLQELEKVKELATGASRAMGEPLGIYGKEAFKQAWTERPVESVFGISPIVGPPIAKGVQYGLSKIPQKPIQPTPQTKDAFRTAIKEIRPNEAMTQQEQQLKTTVLSQLKSAYQKNDINTINSIRSDWKEGFVWDKIRQPVNTGLALKNYIEKPSIKPSDERVLNLIKEEISQGQKGERIFKRGAEGELVDIMGGGSTYPDYFRNKGYTKNYSIAAIDKYLTGQKTTPKETAIIQDLLQSKKDLLLEQAIKIRQEKQGKAEEFPFGENVQETHVMPSGEVMPGKTHQEVINLPQGFKLEKPQQIPEIQQLGQEIQKTQDIVSKTKQRIEQLNQQKTTLNENLEVKPSILDKLKDEIGAIGDVRKAHFENIKRNLIANTYDENIPKSAIIAFGKELGITINSTASKDLAWHKLVQHLANQRGYDIIGGKTPQTIEEQLKQTPKPQEMQEQNIPKAIAKAYQELKSQKGFSNVAISSLQKATGVPMEELKEFLKQESREGRAVLSTGDWSLASPEERQGAIYFEGETDKFGKKIPNLLVRFLESINLESGGFQTGYELIRDKILKARQKKAELRKQPKGIPLGKSSLETIPPTQPKAGSLRYGEELPKYASSINLTNLDEPYDAKKLVGDLVERSGIQRKTVTWEQAKKDAEELGLSEKQLLKRTKGKAENYAYIDAARQVGVDTAVKTRQVMNEAMKIATDMTKTQTERDQALLLANMQMNKAASVLAQVSDMAAESGRALQMFRRKVAGYNATKNYEAMLEALGGREMTLEMLKKFSQIDPSDTKATIQFIRDVSKSKTTDMIYEAWRNAILSGPKTHLSNALSNTINVFSKPAETVIAAGLERGKSLVTGQKPQVTFREVKPEVFGMVQGIKEGVKTGLKSFIEELPSGESKLDMVGDVAIPGKTGKVIRTPQRLLMASDEFSKSIIYRSEINRLAYRIARLEGNKGQALSDRIAELISNPTDDMKERAHGQSVYRTYNKPLGPFGNAVMRLRKIDPTGTLRYIVPFMRTPINVVKFGLERTPLNFARLGYKSAKGQLGGEWSAEYAKPILGSAIAAYLYLLAKEGYITGGGPKDKADRDTLYRTGWQPYSIYIPGKGYYSYQRIEPLGSIVGMVADYKEITDSGKTSEEQAYQALYSINKNWTNKTFLIGLINLSDALSDPERYGEKFINGLATSLVPNITQPFDRNEYLRETTNPIEAMKRKIPYVNEELPLRYDVWGRPIEKTTSTVSPIQRSKEKDDAIDKEALGLQQTVGYTVGMPSKMLSKDTEMTQEQYEKYVKAAGQIAYRQIGKLLNNAVYKRMTDEQKVAQWRRIIEKSRSITKKQVVNYKYN